MNPRIEPGLSQSFHGVISLGVYFSSAKGQLLALDTLKEIVSQTD